MVAAGAQLNASHLATPEAIGPARRGVAEFARAAGIDGEQLEGLRLAVSEAVTNVVLHAYGDEPGEVHVTARVVDDELWVLVADDGVGLSSPAARPGLGWGLAFITDAADEFTIVERAGGGTEARMVFRLPADVATGGESAGVDPVGTPAPVAPMATEADAAGPGVVKPVAGDPLVSDAGQ